MFERNNIDILVACSMSRTCKIIIIIIIIRSSLSWPTISFSHGEDYYDYGQHEETQKWHNLWINKYWTWPGVGNSQ